MLPLADTPQRRFAAYLSPYFIRYDTAQPPSLSLRRHD